MTFTRKIIEVAITLSPKQNPDGTFSQPSFDDARSDTVTLTGYRCAVNITKPGFPSQGKAQVRIHGMTLDLMNKLSLLGRTPISRGFNLIRISAGDDNSPPKLIFSGNMNEAYTDLGGVPEGVFQIFAFSAGFAAVQSIPATSYKGSVDVATIMAGLADQMHMKFENNGVSVQISNPNYPGSALTQAKAAAATANIECTCDQGILAIWPRNGARAGAIPVISPNSGLIGYPYSSGEGLMGLRTAFDARINYGQIVEVNSTIRPACGQWKVVGLTHDIEAEMPGGQWFTTLTLAPPFSKRIGA
jgi:hypothetical protein